MIGTSEGCGMAVFSQVGSRMRKFLYRLPRVETELPMDFILGDAVVLGTCKNLSESGLRGTFSQTVLPGTEGLTTVYHGENKFQIKGRIASLRGDVTHLLFCFESVEQRESVKAFLKLMVAS
jgi:hypothetical protein